MDHLEVLLSIADSRLVVNADTPALPERGPLDDEGVRACGEPVGGGLGQQGVGGHAQPLGRLPIGDSDRVTDMLDQTDFNRIGELNLDDWIFPHVDRLLPRIG